MCPLVFQMIEPVDVFWKCNKGHLSVVHSLPNGDILIANMGDAAGHGKGTFSPDHFNNILPVRKTRGSQTTDFQSFKHQM